MKTLELKLKKDVLIVDLEDNEATHIKGYEFLCEGSELTEEIASELVEEHYMSGVRSYEIYNDYRYNDSRWLNNALDSFISAVESKEKFWLENPIDEPNKYVQRCMSFENLSNQFKLFDEKEEKTFRNPLIFVKNA